MGFNKQLKWELEDPYVSLIFIFSLLMLGVAFYTKLFVVDVHDMPPELTPQTARFQGEINTAYLFPGLDDRSFVILALTGVLLSALTLRYDRDTRVAKSIYSLPVRNYEVVLAKFTTTFTVLFISSTTAALLAYIYAYGDTPGMIVGGMFSQRYLLLWLLYWLEAVLYVSAVSSFIALVSPNTFAAILGGTAALYIPPILGWDFLPPMVLTNGIGKAQTIFWDAGERLNTFLNTTFYPGILLPVILISATLIISEWRDVS
ncbi:MAG: type transport system permease protein [Thermococcaceae archaeon]|nr:type transport system permease protein [Thermococcaceae archaeon]